MSYHHGDLRAALLKEAENLVEQRGVEGLTLRDAARQAGVSHSAPAHHFRDKRDLLTALAVIVNERLEKRMRQAVQSAPADDPREQLVALFLAYVDFARNNPELYLLYSHPKLLDYSNEPFREARAELGEILDTLLENACKAGWLARDDLAAARYSSMAMLRGYAGVITGGLPHYMAKTPEEGAHLVVEGASSAIELFARSILRAPGKRENG